MKRRSAALSFAVIVAVVPAPWAPAQESPPDFMERVFVPFASLIEDPCLAEKVQADGEVRLAIKQTVNADGTFSFVSKDSLRTVTAIGAVTGDVYDVALKTKALSSGESDGAPITNVSKLTFRVNGKNDNPGLLIHISIRFTINASGEVTRDSTDFTYECR
jgi:hypothetical protein